MTSSVLSADAIVFWLFVVAWVIVVGLLVVVLRRVVREGSRIVKRVGGLIQGSDLPLQLAKAQGDANRISSAVDRLPSLRRRAQAALERIRTTPLVPPALHAIVERAKAEVAAFERERR